MLEILASEILPPEQEVSFPASVLKILQITRNSSKLVQPSPLTSRGRHWLSARFFASMADGELYRFEPA